MFLNCNQRGIKPRLQQTSFPVDESLPHAMFFNVNQRGIKPRLQVN
ncbi:hypothetical protein CZ797_02565 [Pseudoalteromonas sp. JB197]|nr:hypothetical protein CZ797_02565 [Pseudoalteromonas sp. JB197]